MNGKQIKKLIWETNTPPPTNYIWVKPNGKPYEFNNNTRKWEESNCFGGISENMSEEEQMEVRKNLGLYYEETSVEEKSVTYTGDSTHLSDDVPTKDNVVKVVNYGDVELDIEIEDSSEGYTIFNHGAYLFSVKEDGIYALGGNVPGTTLFYKMSRTVSKIDPKFLPEQEGGSSLKWLDVTAFSYTGGNAVDISNEISQSDWNDLLDGKYIGIHVLPSALGSIESYYTILNITKDSQGFVYPHIILGNFNITGFDVDNQNKRILYLIGSDVTSMYIRNVTLFSYTDSLANLSGFPTNEMSSTDIKNLGFNASLMTDCCYGKIRAFLAGNYLASIISAVSGTAMSVEFWTNTDKYIVTCNRFTDEFSCTVTPR